MFVKAGLNEEKQLMTILHSEELNVSTGIWILYFLRPIKHSYNPGHYKKIGSSMGSQRLSREPIKLHNMLFALM